MVDSNCIKEVMIFHSVDFYLISLKEFSTVKARNNLHRDLKAIIDVAAATYSARKSLTTKKHLDSNRNDHQLMHPRTERSRVLTSPLCSLKRSAD